MTYVYTRILRRDVIQSTMSLYRIRYALLLSLLVCGSDDLAAQCNELSWGRVPDEHLAMESFPDDPDANAVVLADCGLEEVDLGSYEPKVKLHRHRRVKVLTEGGYDLGTVVIRFREGDRVSRVRGQTFVPTSGDEPRRVELSGDAIYTNEVGDDLHEVRFTLPALEPGAVFEYSFIVENDNFVTLGPWTFQGREPTLYSEYRASFPRRFGYVTSGQQIAHVESVQDQTDRFGENYSEARWVARDVPALREEPYVTTLADYEMRVELQLREYVGGYGRIVPVLSTWPEVAETLLESDRFGRQSDGRSRAVRRQVEELVGPDDDAVTRMEAVHDFVRTSMAWDGYDGSVFMSDRVERILENRAGDSADLNLLLLGLLRAADVPADPVVISTRPHGRAMMEYPMVTQFDRVLVLARPGDEMYLLDATDPGRPFTLLPVEALSGQGFLVSSEPQWIEFAANASTQTTTAVTGTLAPDGTLSGTLALRLSGYDAVSMRRELREAAADGAAASEAASEAAEAGDGMNLTVTDVRGTDDVHEPVHMEADLTAEVAAGVGETLYLDPFTTMGLDENPFKLQERTYPVDFAYPFTRTYVANITLPAGAVTDDLPSPLQIVTPDGGATYVRSIGRLGDVLQVQSRLQIRKTVFDSAEYPALRDFYDRVVASETEVVAVGLGGGEAAVPEAAASEDVAPEADAAETPEEGGR